MIKFYCSKTFKKYKKVQDDKVCFIYQIIKNVNIMNRLYHRKIVVYKKIKDKDVIFTTFKILQNNK